MDRLRGPPLVFRVGWRWTRTPAISVGRRLRERQVSASRQRMVPEIVLFLRPCRSTLLRGRWRIRASAGRPGPTRRRRRLRSARRHREPQSATQPTAARRLSAGTVYSGPVTVASTTTLNAIAYESGWTESAVASAVYTIQCSTVLQLPSWCSVAIGTSSPSDTTTWSNGTFNMSGGNPGTFWTGVADSFNFVYQANPLTGDGTVYARLLASTGGGIQGIMLRAGLGQEDAFVFLGTGYYPANPMMLASRLTAGAASSYTALTSLPMGDLKLSRVGNVVTGSISVDGINWTQVGSPVTFTAIQLYGGLVVAQDFGGYLQA